MKYLLLLTLGLATSCHAQQAWQETVKLKWECVTNTPNRKSNITLSMMTTRQVDSNLVAITSHETNIVAKQKAGDIYDYGYYFGTKEEGGNYKQCDPPFPIEWIHPVPFSNMWYRTLPVVEREKEIVITIKDSGHGWFKTNVNGRGITVEIK